MDSSIKIGFIGAGNIAQAIGICIIKKNLLPPNQIYVSAPSERNFQKWKELGVNTTHNNYEVILQCNIVFLAVKPQNIHSVIIDLSMSKNELDFDRLIISIIAGLSLKALDLMLRSVLQRYSLIKAIPNISIIVGKGTTVICDDEDKPASEYNIKLVKMIMSAGGICEIIPESLMNAASAVSGSGVAFVYSIIEALSDGAVKQGIPRILSYKLAAHTLLGAAEMVLETNEHPAVLKDKVCSPGGTTISGIHALEKGGLRSSLMDAIEATTNKAFELDKK
ncbi:hypothetical protein PGB90_001429 [Kerria lacca]